MNAQDLYDKRVKPAMDEMYQRSTCFLSALAGVKFNFDDMIRYSDVANEWNGKRVTMIPFRSFYLNDKVFMEIKARAEKGLHHYWRWFYRTEPENFNLTEEEWNKAKAELLELKNTLSEKEFDEADHKYRHKFDHFIFHEYLDRLESIQNQRNEGKIDRKQYNKLRDELAKEYHMQWRSRDAESVGYQLCLGPSPTCNDTEAKIIANWCEKLQDGMSWDEAMRCAEEFVDKRYVHDVVSLYRFYQNYKNQN